MAYVETYRGAVDPSHCDHLGHMNVSRYFAVVSDGMIGFQSRLGLTADDVREGRRLSFAVVRAESDFIAEVLAGEPLVLWTGVVELGTKSALFHHRLARMDDSVVFQSLFRAVLLDLATRRATQIPDDIRVLAEPFTVVRE